MNIIKKLKEQLSLLDIKHTNIQKENQELKTQVQNFKDQLDKLKYNNENMLLNIDKALFITKDTKHE